NQFGGTLMFNAGSPISASTDTVDIVGAFYGAGAAAATEIGGQFKFNTSGPGGAAGVFLAGTTP
ncbi:MAG TPA: hypothetical protein VEH84_12530, partial [Alphaproteobacteria bacterium]|nr:hypothetical protein [Alphaproteobacteria bacterium]